MYGTDSYVLKNYPHPRIEYGRGDTYRGDMLVKLSDRTPD